MYPLINSDNQDMQKAINFNIEINKTSINEGANGLPIAP